MARRCVSIRWLWALMGGLLASTLASEAFAFPTSRLVYERGPGTEQCPDQAALRESVASRLGYDPFFPSSDKTIVARVLRDENGLRGQVELVDEHGARLGLRELSAGADECAELLHAMALSISIAIDPKSAETYEQGPPDEPQTTENEASTQQSEAPRPVAATVQPRDTSRRTLDQGPRLLMSAGLGVMGVFSDLPEPTLAGFGFVKLRRSWLSLALEGRADVPDTATQHGVRIRASSYALRALPCAHFGIAFACEVTSLDWLVAEGIATGGKSGTGALLSFGARGGAELMLSPAVGLIGQAEVLLSPWTVQLESAGHPLSHTERFKAGAGFAVALHFP